MSKLQRLMERWALDGGAGGGPPTIGPANPAAAAAAAAAAAGAAAPAAPAAAAPTMGAPPPPVDLQGVQQGLSGLRQYLGYPFEQVGQHRQVQQGEQIRDITTSGAGMADATRENLVQYFTQLGLGITPEVDKSIADLSTTMTVDWSDPMAVDTLFGTYDPQRQTYATDGVLSKALKNGGPPLAAFVMGSMKEFYGRAMRNPLFNRGEMMEIFHHWLKGDMDPSVLAIKTRGFLDAATRNPEDGLAFLGIKDPAAADDARRLRQLFQNILGAISERPDQSQRSVALGERAYQRWRQQNYRAWEAMARRMGVPVYKAMEIASQWSGGAANLLGDFGNPWVNAAMVPATWMAQVATTPQVTYLPFGQAGGTVTGYNPLQTLPAVSQVPTIVGPQRAAAEDRSDRFVRLAQVWNPSMAGGQIDPQMGSVDHDAELAAQQQDMLRMMGNENLMAADASELWYGQLISNELALRMGTVKNDVSRLQQDITAYEEDYRTGRGAADLRLIDSVNEMSAKLAEKYGELLGIYDEALRMLATKRRSAEQAAAYSGKDPNIDRNVRQYDVAARNIAAQRKEITIQRNTWLLKSHRLAEDFRVQARDVMSVQPLRTMRDVLREGYGADAGASLALASEEMAQARSRMKQYNKLRGLDPNVGGMQAGHALNQAYQQNLSAIRDIDRSAQPSLQPGQQAEVLGVE